MHGGWLGTLLAVASVTSAAVVVAPLAVAQTTLDPARETQRLRRDQRDSQSQNRLGTTSRRLDQIMGRTVTYDDVLKDPDNIPLNLAFARTQIREGDLNGAAATLERVLLIRPGNLSVRVLYAVVLYRLDARNDAERELRTVLRFRLPPALRAELASYLSEIRWRKKLTRWTLLVHSSIKYETNRNSGPEDDVVPTPSGSFTLTGEDAATDDFAFRGLARLSVEHRFGGARGHKLLGTVGVYHSEQQRLNRLTLGTVDAGVGVLWDLAPVELRILGTFRYLRLSHERFLVSGGPDVSALWWLSKTTALIGRLRITLQDFDELNETSTQARRTGPEVATTVALRHRLTVRMRLTGGVRTLRKLADESFWSYYGIGAFLRHEWLLGRGMYLLSGASWTWHHHDRANFAESTSRRSQHYLRLGTTFGLPVATLFGTLPVPRTIGAVNISLGISVERSFSNIPTFRYTNWQITLGATRRFSF